MVAEKKSEWQVVLEVGQAFEVNFHILPSSVAILELLFLLMMSVKLQVQGS